MDNYILLLGLVVVLYLLYQSNETFENEKMQKNKECSTVALNKAIYGYNVNTINRGAR
jgi:hypothetical protein